MARRRVAARDTECRVKVVPGSGCQLKGLKILGKYFCQNPGTRPRSSDSWVAAVKAVLVLLVCCVQTSGKESVGRRRCDLKWKCILLTKYTGERLEASDKSRGGKGGGLMRAGLCHI